MRMTKNVKTILNLLKKEKRPMSAELIMKTLPENTMDLSTVYRSLIKLYQNNLISKSTLKKTSFYHLNQEKHQHYMLCLGCSKTFLVECVFEKIAPIIEENSNYSIIGHDLTFYGYCKTCQAKI